MRQMLEHKPASDAIKVDSSPLSEMAIRKTDVLKKQKAEGPSGLSLSCLDEGGQVPTS